MYNGSDRKKIKRYWFFSLQLIIDRCREDNLFSENFDFISLKKYPKFVSGEIRWNTSETIIGGES